MRASEQSGQPFPSLLKRRWAQVRAIHSEKVERKQACVLRRLRPQPVKVVARVLTFEHGFAVQHDAFSRYCPEHFDNQRERRRPTQTATAPQPHALAILAGDDAIAVVLDLMHPERTGRRDLGEGRNARGDKAGRTALAASGSRLPHDSLSEPAAIDGRYPSCLT